MEADGSEQNRRYDRTSAEQIKCYVTYCKEHPEIPMYQTEKSYKTAPKRVQDLWTQLVNELNAMRGPTRDVKRWRLKFLHWKKALRCRARKLKAEGLSDSTLPAYSELVLHDGKPQKKKVKIENSHDTMDNTLEESEDSNESTVEKEDESDVEYPFDAIFYPDKNELSSSIQSRPSTPVKSNRQSSAKEDSVKCCCHKLMKTLEARDERFFTQQQSAINKLDQTLLLMTKVLEKINDKLDKL
ncbi:uncharacterized protein [Eurosta solidaginis]|uniref:uncharacterized protein n=1 Tax=Eurosta solidaginis TaxID=178769 RepID=UPI0035310788